MNQDTKREDILKRIWNVGNKILRPSNNKHITAPAKSGHHTTFIISKSKVQIWAHWPPFFGLFACFQRYLERCFYSAGQTHYYQFRMVCFMIVFIFRMVWVCMKEWFGFWCSLEHSLIKQCSFASEQKVFCELTEQVNID